MASFIASAQAGKQIFTSSSPTLDKTTFKSPAEQGRQGWVGDGAGPENVHACNFETLELAYQPKAHGFNLGQFRHRRS
jgi:hypothetical protein